MNPSRGRRPTVLVLVADLSRSGVPVVLERYLRGSGGAAADIHVVARRGGALVPTVRALAAGLTVLEPDGGRSVTDVAALALSALGTTAAARSLRHRRLRSRLALVPPPDVVLVHGAGGLPLLDELAPAAPVVVHLHELATGLARSGPAAVVARQLRRATSVLAVSTPVADLARGMGVATERLHVVPGVVDPSGPFPADDARRLLGGDGPVVGGVGRPGHRKGTDRLAALAHELGRERAVRVVWVGGRPAGKEAVWLGSPDPVEWLPARPEPWALLAGVDAVVVPSREDPLPLAALEAGQQELPVVASATGGLPDLLGAGRGLVVDPYDVPGLVAAVRTVLDRPDEARALGSRLHAHVEAHHTVSVVVPQWWELLGSAAGR